jgi:hypothetical protein
MGHGKQWNGIRPGGLPKSSVGFSGDNYDDELGGICPNCGQYEQELAKDGYCRDEDCHHDRIVKAIKKGEARMLPNGTFLWTKGVKTFKDI